jgi:uncharacterized protein (DUF362 family)
MPKLSRREFLQALAAGMGAVIADQFLVACGQEGVTPQAPLPTIPLASATQTETAQSAPTADADETATQPAPTDPPTLTPQPAPDLVVARNGEPEILVQQALAPLGGLAAFVQPGANVVIKPNICVGYHTYEYAATTNPWVVGALVKLAFEAGAASVRVMDNPFGGLPEPAYAKSGIKDQVEAAGGEMVVMSNLKFVDIELPNPLSLKRTKIYDDILKADVVINVPIAKHHNLAGLTLGMKNLLGVIHQRSPLHARLGENLTDLATFIRPALTVIDAVRVLRKHGPTGGDLRDVDQLDTLIVSPDIVAADSYAATLFDKQPMDLSYIQAGVQSGLGRADLENLRIEEIDLA